MKKSEQKEIVAEGKLNEVIFIETKRPNKTTRIQQDFQFCPTMAEQHTAHLTDINYLMEKYTPDALEAYIMERNMYRQEILGHDFSQEPSMQEGMNVVYRIRTAFDQLAPEIKNNFKNHVEFLKFIDNPANQEKMLKLGIMTKKEIAQNSSMTPTTTQEETKDATKTERSS